MDVWGNTTTGIHPLSVVAVERGAGLSEQLGLSEEEELSENDVDELVELAFASEASFELESELSNGTQENVP